MDPGAESGPPETAPDPLPGMPGRVGSRAAARRLAGAGPGTARPVLGAPGCSLIVPFGGRAQGQLRVCAYPAPRSILVCMITDPLAVDRPPGARRGGAPPPPADPFQPRPQPHLL